ncbi:hypothetical protein ASD67_13645 [Sphingopyxis sp. Root1497]|uniref:hypothetical protein n=1 Tax=Sphingopyxis sp. Root1497 TaxID=1736474 RepID=UPI000715B9AD|nr:hypothetical protein [Sphingopyxis sp. Root1497]KQZ62565.1 hypothetical protein ASD67_13645 [Sphingopyxis sp. Root1497]
MSNAWAKRGRVSTNPVSFQAIDDGRDGGKGFARIACANRVETERLCAMVIARMGKHPDLAF